MKKLSILILLLLTFAAKSQDSLIISKRQVIWKNVNFSKTINPISSVSYKRYSGQFIILGNGGENIGFFSNAITYINNYGSQYNYLNGDSIEAKLVYAMGDTVFSGGSTDTTSLSNRINLKLDKNDTTNYLGLNRSSNIVNGSIGMRFISAPAGNTNTTSLFADATGRLAWRNGTGFLRTFDASTITADRVYTLPNATTTLAGLSVANTWSAQQRFTGATGTSLLNFPDAGTTAADGISFGVSNLPSIYRNVSTGLSIASGSAIWQFNSAIFTLPTNQASTIRMTPSRNFIIDNGTQSIVSIYGTSYETSITPPTLTGSSATSAFSVTQTWNGTGNQKGVLFNFINTASGATARPFEVQINSSPVAFVDKTGAITSTKFCLSSLNTAPSSSNDTGTLGEVRITATYIYVCTATNTWVRSALATW